VKYAPDGINFMIDKCPCCATSFELYATIVRLWRHVPPELKPEVKQILEKGNMSFNGVDKILGECYNKGGDERNGQE